MSVMGAIKLIEAEMEEVNNSFKKLDNPTLEDYIERDDKLSELLEERDRLHGLKKKVVK